MGTDFGPSDRGSVMIIPRDLYVLTCIGASWCSKIEETPNSMGYRSIESDPDVWLKRAMKPSVEEYFKYIFVYVDRILYWSHDKR